MSTVCEDLILDVPTRALHQICDPFRTPPWDIQGELTPELVLFCCEEDLLLSQPVGHAAGLSAETHARRIAWLVKQGWSDPISLEFSCPEDVLDWLIKDGNHRFYAALLRKDETISASIGGYLDAAEEAFGIIIP